MITGDIGTIDAFLTVKRNTLDQKYKATVATLAVNITKVIWTRLLGTVGGTREKTSEGPATMIVRSEGTIATRGPMIAMILPMIKGTEDTIEVEAVVKKDGTDNVANTTKSRVDTTKTAEKELTTPDVDRTKTTIAIPIHHTKGTADAMKIVMAKIEKKTEIGNEDTGKRSTTMGGTTIEVVIGEDILKKPAVVIGIDIGKRLMEMMRPHAIMRIATNQRDTETMTRVTMKGTESKTTSEVTMRVDGDTEIAIMRNSTTASVDVRIETMMNSNMLI